MNYATDPLYAEDTRIHLERLRKRRATPLFDLISVAPDYTLAGTHSLISPVAEFVSDAGGTIRESWNMTSLLTDGAHYRVAVEAKTVDSLNVDEDIRTLFRMNGSASLGSGNNFNLYNPGVAKVDQSFEALFTFSPLIEHFGYYTYSTTTGTAVELTSIKFFNG